MRIPPLKHFSYPKAVLGVTSQLNSTAILRWAVGFGLAYYLIVGATAVAIYHSNKDNGWTRLVNHFFAYPAGYVNGQAIPLDQFRQEVAVRRFYAQKQNLPASEYDIEQLVLTQEENHLLYQQKLASLKVTITDVQVQKQLDQLSAQVQGQDKLLSFLQTNYGPQINLDQFKRWIHDSLLEAGIQEQLLSKATVRHILIALPNNPGADQVEAARLQAVDVRSKISKPENFAAVAKDFSEDVASRDNGGLLGTTVRGADQPAYVQDLEQSIFTLPIGEVSDPIRSRIGWHILLVDKRTGTVNESLGQYTDELRKGAKLKGLFAKP